jgi:hypothetical protein
MLVPIALVRESLGGERAHEKGERPRGSAKRGRPGRSVVDGAIIWYVGRWYVGRTVPDRCGAPKRDRARGDWGIGCAIIDLSELDVCRHSFRLLTRSATGGTGRTRVSGVAGAAR